MSCKNIYPVPAIDEHTHKRFLKKVKKSNDGCWLWTGGITIWGYGQFWLSGREYGAHRISYSMHRGKIPKGKFVLHSCDVRNCVNPSHLFIGTQKQNVHDAFNKGRRWGWTAGKTIVNCKRDAGGRFAKSEGRYFI